MIFVAAVAGYLIGSLPTAESIARLWGVDLRQGGSKNPGANNALRLGGPILGATVLLIEMAKGLAAVMAGMALAGEPGTALGAVGAVAGNVYNVWYGFGGGKGLGISAGVLAGAWPAVLVPIGAVMAAMVWATRSSGPAAIGAIATLNLCAVAWWVFGWPTGWGLSPGPLLALVSVGIGLTLWRKHLEDTRVRRPLLH